MKQTFFRFLATVSFAILGTAQAQQYVQLERSFPSGTPGKVEVLEFFSYGCSHCAAIEPLLQRFKTELPSQAVLVPVPVAFNHAAKPMQQFYYTLVAMNRSDLHPVVFQAIHQQKKPLFTRKEIIKWAVSQGLDEAKFTSTFDSFGVDAKVRRATELSNLYKVQATPSFSVGGKYLTSPAMTGSYEGSLAVVRDLLKKF